MGGFINSDGLSRPGAAIADIHYTPGNFAAEYVLKSGRHWRAGLACAYDKDLPVLREVILLAAENNAIAIPL
jgi:hypothetical protein